MLVNSGYALLTDTAPSLSEWERNSDKSSASEEIVESVDADVDCSCPSDCSST